VAARDSVAYWAAARLLLHNQNPYDPERVLSLERRLGYSADRPLVLRTPPWSLFMVTFLGPLDPLSAWIAWIAVLIGSLIAGMRICRRMYGLESMPQSLFPCVGYLFAPVPACLVAGQMGLLLMLGVALFLLWEERRPFLAGAALIMPFAKPHLLFLFWLVLLCWAILQRKWKVGIGFVLALTGATSLALFFDPLVFAHYREMLQVAAIQHEFIPALSGVLRLLFFRHLFWVQFVPLLLGLTWGLGFFLRRRDSWDWAKHGPALLVVAVLTTPYAWLADEAVLLPAILQGVAFVYGARAQISIRSKCMLVLFAMLDFLLLLILRSKIPFSTGIYFWSGLVWFGWYFYARRFQLTQLSL